VHSKPGSTGGPQKKGVQFCETKANAKNSDLPFFSKQQHGPFGKFSSTIIKLLLQKVEHRVTLKERGLNDYGFRRVRSILGWPKFAPVRCICLCLRVTISTQFGYWHYSSFHQASIISRASRSDRGSAVWGLGTSDLASPFLIPVPTQQADLKARTSWAVAPIKPALAFSTPQPAAKSTSPGKVGTDTSNSRSTVHIGSRERVRVQVERKGDRLEPRSLQKGGKRIDNLLNSFPASPHTNRNQTTYLPACLAEH